MDRNQIAQALRARAPSIAEAGVDLDALATTALAAWTTHGHTALRRVDEQPSHTPMPAGRIHAVVDAIWPSGYRAGVHAGHAVTVGYIATAALDRAEPARPGMSDAHRDLANRLQAGRVSTDALQAYLISHGWQHARAWRGAAIFHTTMAGDVAEALVPTPGMRDHVLRILDAATTVANVEDRDVASVLADRAPPPARAPLSHAALRYLWRVYDTATELAHLPPQVNDPGPSNNDYLTAYGDWGDGSEIGRLVAATRVGYQHGFHEGHGDGTWSAQLPNAVPTAPSRRAGPVRVRAHRRPHAGRLAASRRHGRPLGGRRRTAWLPTRTGPTRVRGRAGLRAADRRAARIHRTLCRGGPGTVGPPPVPEAAMTTPTSNSDLKARTAELWREAIVGHPNEGALLRGDVLGRVLDPAVDAWQDAPAGDQQVLAAATVGWQFGYRHNVQTGIERAATTVADDLRQARDRNAARPAGATALASAARQVGLDPDDPNHDLQLHALADALALSGVDLAERDRRQGRDLTKIMQIAARVARPTETAPARRDMALPGLLADDVLAADRAATPAEPARRLFAAVGLGWQAGIVIGEDVGAVYAVHRIAATAANDPGLRFGRMTPAQWTEHTLGPVKARLEQRLGPQAGQVWAEAAHAASQDPATAPGPAPSSDHTTRPRVGNAFGPLTAVAPASAGPADQPASPGNPAAPTHHRRR